MHESGRAQDFFGDRAELSIQFLEIRAELLTLKLVRNGARHESGNAPSADTLADLGGQLRSGQ